MNNLDLSPFIPMMLIGTYFFPTIFAFWRGRDGLFGTFCFNLMFGWTVIGWCLSLLAAYAPTNKEIAYRNEVRRARDQFYLREAEKAKSN